VRLSICIATYRRAGMIGATLDSILPGLTDDVELLVVDGASPDETEAVVAGRFQGRANCRYLRLAAKGGVDRDYCIAVEQAYGDYVWLMTDDDALKPGAVARVLAALAGEPDLVVVNAEVADADLGRTLLDRKLRLAADRTVAPGQRDELLALTGDLLTFIGSVVVRRETWQARDKESWVGTEFVHVGVIFQAPLGRPARVIAEPLVRIRYGLAQWAGRAFEIWMFNWPKLIWGLAGIGEAAKAAVTPREPWRHTGRLLTMKAQGHYTLAAYRRWLAPLPMPRTHRLGAWLLAVWPRSLFVLQMRLVVPLLPPHEREMMKFELSRH